jgi:hypothetical protein
MSGGGKIKNRQSAMRQGHASRFINPHAGVVRTAMA